MFLLDLVAAIAAGAAVYFGMVGIPLAAAGSATVAMLLLLGKIGDCQ